MCVSYERERERECASKLKPSRKTEDVKSNTTVAGDERVRARIRDKRSSRYRAVYSLKIADTYAYSYVCVRACACVGARVCARSCVRACVYGCACACELSYVSPACAYH